MPGVNRILVPVDFSIRSDAAVAYAAFLGKQLGASVDLLHALAPPRFQFEANHFPTVTNFRALEEGRRRIRHYLDALDDDGVVARGDLDLGNPTEVILKYANEYDLIVMGTHGRGGVSHLVLGSVTESIQRKGPCPVLTLRVPEDALPWLPAARLPSNFAPHQETNNDVTT